MPNITFIISSRGKYAKLFKTLASMTAQTNKNFNVVVVIDPINDVVEGREKLFQYFKQNKNFSIIFNTKIQGAAVDWNTAISLTQTNYFAIIKEGDELVDSYVETFEKVIQKEGPLDVIEYTIDVTKLAENTTTTFLIKNKKYDLKNEFEPFAYLNSWIYNKIFNLKLIKDAQFQFRLFVRFDALFAYRALASADSYYYIDKVMATHVLSIIKYSAFDLVNQWPHILNHYRRISMYKKIQNELQYAYYKDLIHNFMWLISKFDNKVLVKKAASFVQRKVEPHIEEFKKNPIFIKSKDTRFKEIINNLNDYLKKMIKDVK
ncbi:glycosyltransferase family 2 protein [Spiroplasma endosymbiont of Labia minor]|uniref:glycosyltransferase family A protein n=1 Tax=Spiroplasma endosymbiont of Labia minor TaxID=3066305 RepID=UPI0030CE6E69